MALRNARDLYTRRARGRLDLGGAVHADHRLLAGREGLVLRARRRQALPAPDVLRDPGRGAAPVMNPIPSRPRPSPSGDDALVLVPPAGGVGRPRPGAGGGGRPRQHRAGPARPGPGAALPRRRRGRAGLSCARSARSATSSWSSSPTATSPTPSPASSTSPSTSELLYEQSRRRRRASCAAGRRRPSRRSPTTRTTPSSGRCGSATARRRATSGCSAAWTPCGGSPASCSSRSRAWTSTGRRCRTAGWRRVTGVLERATLTVPDGPRTGAWTAGAGRQGMHTEPFGRMLAEMQHLHRSHPGASW